MVLMNFLASCGMPLIAVYSPLVALVLNVALNLALVPSMGFAGAAVSSSVAYGLMLAMSLAYIRSRLLPGDGAIDRRRPIERRAATSSRRAGRRPSG
jgi:Na+-driven multidrug efflux pump